MHDNEDWLPEEYDEYEEYIPEPEEWTLKDAEELITAYKENANKKWEVELLDWILDRVWRYEDLNS